MTMARRLIPVICFVLISFLLTSCTGDGKGGEPKRADSKIAYSFSLPDINGNKVDLVQYRGKVVILDFFATWCEPCRLLAPELKAFYERYKDKGVAVIGISIDEGPDALKMVKSYVKENGITYTTVIDDGKSMKKYDVFSMPTTVIIDKEGNIRSKHLGITADYTKRLAAEVEPLLN
jgi:peroxiredoxin